MLNNAGCREFFVGTRRHRRLDCLFSSCLIAALIMSPVPVVFAQSAATVSGQVEGAQPIPAALGLSGSYGRLKDDRNGFLGTTRWHQETLSGETRLGGFQLGLSASHNWSRKELDEHILTSGPDAGGLVLGGTTKSRSNAFLASAGRHFGAVYIGGFIGYGQGETDEFRQGEGVTASWERDFHTRTIGVNVSTLLDIGEGWYLVPSAQYIRFKSVSDATVDSLGNLVDREENLLVRGRLGGEVGYQTLLGELVATAGLRPYVVHDFVLFRDYTDETAADLTGFLTFAGEQFTAGIEVSTELGRKETDSVSGRLFVGVKF